MELSQIRYFLDVAHTRHISKSAQRLHIAQPALTKSMHKLEEELGVPLFVRSGRNIALSEHAVRLKERLRPVIAALDSISEDFSQLAEIENQTIRLSVSAASTLITHAIIEYKRTHPQVSFHLLQNADNELFDIEVSTALSYNAVDSPNHFICSEKIFVAVPNIEKYKNKASIGLCELKEEGFISLFSSKQLRNICDGFCHDAGFEPKVTFESDSPYAVKNMIAANLGIGFWPEFTWGPIDNENIRLLDISSPLCKRDILLTLGKNKAINSCSRSFYEFLVSYFKRGKEKGL